MYIILWWRTKDDNFLTAIFNRYGSLRLFETLKEADEFANNHEYSEDLRVISIEAVK